MYTYEIDTSLLPKVWVTWTSTKNKKFNKRFWLNCQTGEKKETPESWMQYDGEESFKSKMYISGGCGVGYWNKGDDNVWVKDGTSLKYGYLKYHPDIDQFEIAVVGIDTSRKPEPHHWKYLGDRYFVDKNKVITDVYGNIKTSGFNAYEWHEYSRFKDFLSCTTRVYVNNHYADEFRKFYGSDSMTIRSGRIIEFTYAWSAWAWYVYKAVSCSSSKRKLIETLTSTQLSDSSGFSHKYPPLSYTSDSFYSQALNNVVYFERVDDTWSVLRGFYRGYNASNPLKEKWRLYISDKGKLQMLSAQSDSWISSVIGTYTGYYLANPEVAIEKCNRIKYILKAYSNAKRENVVPMLIRALQYPEVEQMIKFGHADIVSRYNCSRTFRADMKYEFGGYYNPKEKNFLKKIGMTKQQFDAMMESGVSMHGSHHLGLMRSVFGDDLSHLDIVSFRRYYKGFLDMSRSYYGLDDRIQNLGVDRQRFYKNIIRLGEKNESAYQLTADTVRGYVRLDDHRKPHVDWIFDSYSDLFRAHESVTTLARQQDEERRRYMAMAEAERRAIDEKNRIKRDKDRAKYEYDDGEYIIRLPKDLTEIVNEGSFQHICIGGYTSRHANGETNIFFLRKKSDENIPFYAIEMRNNSIIQIHGKYNQWLGCNPEAIPTVMRWLRKNGIQCDTKILTCTAKGYGQTNNYIALPTID